MDNQPSPWDEVVSEKPTVETITSAQIMKAAEEWVESWNVVIIQIKLFAEAYVKAVSEIMQALSETPGFKRLKEGIMELDEYQIYKLFQDARRAERNRKRAARDQRTHELNDHSVGRGITKL